MNFLELIEKFPTEKSVINHFVSVRYGNEPCCNLCGSLKVYQRNKNPKVFDCNDCNGSFSPFKGTIFEKSSTDLRKWMYAIHLFLNGKKGISGLQLQREIKVTYKTAWRMLKQIRIAMGNTNDEKFCNTVIEMDETYVGGKPKRDDDNNKRGRGTRKTPVVGVINRTTKQVKAQVAKANRHGKKLTGIQLLNILDKYCRDERSIIITDEFTGYNRFSKTNHLHLRVDHSREYSNGSIHTNNIESFWATLKRGIYGTYHHVGVDYLQYYVNEFCFRYNNRKNSNMFDLVLKQAIL